MSLNTEALTEALQALDKIIGNSFKDLAVDADRNNTMVRLRANCRVCGAGVHAEQNHMQLGWGQRIIAQIVEAAKTHGKKHSLVLPASHGGNA